MVRQLKIGNFEVKGYAALAPMAGVADRAMREISLQHGAAYCIGELASAKGISLGDKKSASYLKVSDTERPYGSQLFGCDPLVMAEAAKAAAAAEKRDKTGFPARHPALPYRQPGPHAGQCCAVCVYDPDRRAVPVFGRTVSGPVEGGCPA